MTLPNTEYGHAENWIGVDLDGTLAEYKSGQYSVMGAHYIGAPVPSMLRRVKRWRDEGKTVKIFTARVDGGRALPPDSPALLEYRDTERMRRCIEAWCVEHIGEALPITNIKDYGMVELWDDRAVGVERNTGYVLHRKRSKFLASPVPWCVLYATLVLLCAQGAIFCGFKGAQGGHYATLWFGQTILCIALTCICGIGGAALLIESPPWEQRDED